MILEKNKLSLNVFFTFGHPRLLKEKSNKAEKLRYHMMSQEPYFTFAEIQGACVFDSFGIEGLRSSILGRE